MKNIMNTKKVSVLFICEGNACRSILAEALTRFYWGNHAYAASAGIRPLGQIPEETLTVLEEVGVPTEGLFSKKLDEIDLSSFQLIVNLALVSIEEHLPKDFKGQVFNWYIRDPYRGNLQSFRQTRDALDWFITEKLPEILELYGLSGES